MNDQFIQGIIFDWNKIDDDSYLKQIEALKDVERLEFQNSINFFVGENGSGKSTLLHIIGGLDNPTSGQVIVDGQNLSHMPDEELTIFRRRNIGFVFQQYNLVPMLNVWENIVLPVKLDGKKIEKISYEDTESYAITEMFINNREVLIKHLLE